MDYLHIWNFILDPFGAISALSRKQTAALTGLFGSLLVVALAFLMMIIVGCTPAPPNGDLATATRPSLVTIPPTLTSDELPIEEFMALLTTAGADVVNNGRTEQGLFPVEDIDLWHLAINGANVNVYAFADATAPSAITSHPADMSSQ